ncbi:hypothetical protein EJ04DRAFT_565543 [Polyplosphaeria fusca]|uniref:Apple domain-containing protein n=1 Tax=Polyplosphaeria fusca TaxID=682080 RepID=A0A9P4UY95_9PLEO|nr:hypothetical protein EJ04DRAFT_565543 [Polyplosphaeria fusca]
MPSYKFLLAVLPALTLATPSTIPRRDLQLPSCPNSNGTSYIDPTTNNNFTLTCGMDFPRGNLAVTQTSTLAGCLEACSATMPCIGVSYTGENCYLKRKLNSPVSNPSVAIASIEGPIIYANQPETRKCGEDFASFEGCPTSDGCNDYSLGPDGDPMTILCGRDFYGGDLAQFRNTDFDTCYGRCSANHYCVGFSHVPSYPGTGTGRGVCYLKSELALPIHSEKSNVAYMRLAPY